MKAAVIAILLFTDLALLLAGEVRERIAINDGWRFTRGDPANFDSRNLLYDVRPVVRGDDQRERLAEATADAEKLAATTNRASSLIPSSSRA